MKMWDIATSNQGGRGLASFVGTMNCNASKHSIEICLKKGWREEIFLRFTDDTEN